MFRRNSGAKLPWSITARLITLYTLSGIVILAVSLCSLAYALASSVRNQSTLYLRDEIRVVNEILASSGTDAELVRRLRIGKTVREHTKTYVRILDCRGKTIAETDDMARLLPQDRFPEADNLYPKYVVREACNTRSYLLHTQGESARQRSIQIALDVTESENTLAGYMRQLAAVLAVGILCSFAAGMYITSRCLKPLRDILETTQRTTVSTLDQRIDNEGWPREIKAIGDSINLMFDRLQESFALLTACADDLAHELRTPMTNLMGEAEIVLSRERAPDEYRQTIESSLQEYRRMSRMIDSLLFLAKTDRLQRPVAPEQVDLREEIENLGEYFAPLADEKEITVEVTGSATTVGDRRLIARAVANVIVNSLTFTLPGGSISLAVAGETDGSATIIVTDTGIGIEAKYLPRMFDRFFRCDETRHLDPEGCGLGLAVVRSIMSLHGGTAAVDSIWGAGTWVTLSFPPAEKST